MAVTNFDQISLDKETKIASPDATAMTASYVQADVQKLVVLVNEMKAKLNTIFKV